MRVIEIDSPRYRSRPTTQYAVMSHGRYLRKIGPYSPGGGFIDRYAYTDHHYLALLWDSLEEVQAVHRDHLSWMHEIVELHFVGPCIAT